MKNKMKKLILIAAVLIGSFAQTGCGPLIGEERCGFGNKFSTITFTTVDIPSAVDFDHHTTALQAIYTETPDQSENATWLYLGDTDIFIEDFTNEPGNQTVINVDHIVIDQKNWDGKVILEPTSDKTSSEDVSRTKYNIEIRLNSGTSSIELRGSTNFTHESYGCHTVL